MNRTSLPHSGRVLFKDDTDTLITTAMAYWGPLTSEYKGYEVSASDIKNTALFVCPGFSQHKLTTRIVDQGDYIWARGDSAEKYLITGLKDFRSHSEFVGLKASAVVSGGSPPTGLVSWYPFLNLSGLGNDAMALNYLTNVNTVAFSADKPSQTSSSYGSADFTAADSEQLEIADASQSGLDITGNITLAFRFKLKSLPSAPFVYDLLSKHAGSPDISYEAFIGSSPVRICCTLSGNGTSGTIAIGGTNLSTGTWYSYAAVYNGTDIRCYLNGSLDSNSSNNPKTYSSGIYNGAAKFILGAKGDASSFLDGYLHDVYVFNTNKSSSQISTWHSSNTWT